MNIGFFFVLRREPIHFLHGASLVREAKRWMPNCPVMQLTDQKSPKVPGIDNAVRLWQNEAPLLEQRLKHYANCSGEWLHVDTDVSIRNNVQGVFDDKVFDVALCDRNWSHLPQSEHVLHTMPFNTGVVFVRNHFWQDVLNVWLNFPKVVQDDWLSEQRAVYEVVKSGRHRVKILPGALYNYPPTGLDDAPITAALVHYKGNRKDVLSKHATQVMAS